VCLPAELLAQVRQHALPTGYSPISCSPCRLTFSVLFTALRQIWAAPGRFQIGWRVPTLSILFALYSSGASDVILAGFLRVNRTVVGTRKSSVTTTGSFVCVFYSLSPVTVPRVSIRV